MKIIGISDPHGTSKIPRGRLGDPLKDFYSKMLWIFKQAKKLDNAPIICSGDLFDTPRDIPALFKLLSITYRFPEIKFYCVFGQHDMYMRNKKALNNLQILSRSNVIKLLNSKPITIPSSNINLYGCNWNDKFPVPIFKDKINILSIHASITKEKLFPGQDFHKTSAWLKLYGYYDFIIIGDIHRSAIGYYKMKNGKRGVFANTGPIMRLEVTEYMKEHKPKILIYDTEKRNFEVKHIPINPFKEVLNYGINEETGTLTEEKILDWYIDTKELEDVNIMKIIDLLVSKSKNKKGIRLVLSDIAEEINNDTKE